MPPKNWKNVTFKLDNSAGTLTALTTSSNQASLESAMELLDATCLGDSVRKNSPGITEISIPWNGFLNSTTEGIFGPILNGTSVTKTFEIYNGIKYINGEVWPGDISFGYQAGAIATVSATLTIDGTVNRTSTALP